MFASACLGLVCKYVHAHEVLIFVRYADSRSEHNNDQISSCGALQPPRTNAGQTSVFALLSTNKYTYSYPFMVHIFLLFFFLEGGVNSV